MITNRIIRRGGRLAYSKNKLKNHLFAIYFQKVMAKIEEITLYGD